MSRINPYNLQMQITRLFQEGQGIFATIKVQDWLRSNNHNPAEYDILFHKKPAPPGSQLVMIIEIELRRKDDQPVDTWLQEQVNLRS
ncbi:MAG: hypothetical protein HC916_07590 [Coleofasciculaceae cyanobacterium SM2_1_6]|nr:hypothetical protein [Coleofasciculaceae cyanobacterium SM2_1_6]